ncbi:MAG: glucose-1-phosphate cytidylyltransferase [Planctomycetes bacterium]|nr:glucose-1-phosphate cytidylyltransferase [Planctomycetota bacterium]
MKVVILCGGQGSRIRDVSEIVPKPMLPIAGKPILWHIMKIYATHGLSDFVLCLGYKGWMIKEFFLNYRCMMSDCTVNLGHPEHTDFHDNIDEATWRVTLADTGEQTMTGGRVWRVRQYLADDDIFCLTYGDGVADVNIGALIRHHKRSGLVATVTGVRVAGRFGELSIFDGRVNAFNEKPAATAGLISGGFMVFDAQRIWDYFDEADDLVLERETFERLVADRQLGVYKHDGYWQCMDTPREFAMLNEIWQNGQAPWKIWKDPKTQVRRTAGIGPSDYGLRPVRPMAS